MGLAVLKPNPPKRIVVYWFSQVKPPEPVAKQASKYIQEAFKTRPVMIYMQEPYDDLRVVKKILSKLRRGNSLAIVAASPRVLQKLLEAASEQRVADRVYVPVIEATSWPPQGEHDGFAKYCAKDKCYAVRLRALVPLQQAVSMLAAA